MGSTPWGPFRGLLHAIEQIRSENGWAAYSKFRQSYVTDLDEADWDALRLFFAAHADLMAQILCLADCPEDVCASGFWDMLSEHTEKYVSCGEPTLLLTARVALSTHDDERETALEDLMAAVRLASLFLREKEVFYRMPHVSSLGIVLHHLSVTMPESFLAPEQYRGFIRELGQIDVYGNLEGLLLRSLDENSATFDQIRREGISSWHSGGFLYKQYMRFYGSPLARPLLDIDEARSMEFGERVAALSERPAYQTREELARLQAEFCGPGFGRVFTRLCSFQARLTTTWSRNETQIELARLGLAIGIHRAETGAYPQTLADVAHELGGSVPVDPFTGASYVYRPGDDAFLLYSVGPDFEDDGGNPDFREGDIVWRGE